MHLLLQCSSIVALLRTRSFSITMQGAVSTSSTHGEVEEKGKKNRRKSPAHTCL